MALEDPTTGIVYITLLVFIFLIGLYPHFKIIVVANKEKDMTWKLDIAHSIILIFHYAFNIAFHAANYFIPSLHVYIGSWFCYMSTVITVYGTASIVGHSCMISLMKYVMIVHREKVAGLGFTRIRTTLFVVNLLHPLPYTIANVFVENFEMMTSLKSCLGISSTNIAIQNEETFSSIMKKLWFCGLGNFEHHDSFDYFVYVVKQGTCFTLSIIAVVIFLNILEFFFYRRIFRYMQR